MPRASSHYMPAATPQRSSTTKVPLNDDRQEKANRRHAQLQRESMRASATPARSRRSLAVQDSPHTPAMDEDIDMPDVTGTAVTPMKRPVPILANFEEWTKLATDNKINANNAFNIALIDYFHEMSLLKEGDGVSFQKASVTLDGCVKIYTSRVDSINTDTGKLLSGLAESGNKKKQKDGAEGSGDEDEEGDGDDGQRKKKKRAPRAKESSLADSFEALQNKKMDLDLSVDPLFKKASADFDEGGAKGLLLNHLAIDSNGRIVFDSSDDVKDATQSSRETPAPEGFGEEDEGDENEQPSEDVVVDISGLAAKYFPNLARLDNQDICPSMKDFELGDANGSIDLPFLKAAEEDEPKQPKDEEDAGDLSGVFLDGDNAPDFDDDDIGFNLPPETGFGEGGELWANQVALEPQARVHNIEAVQGEEDGADAGDGALNANDHEYTMNLHLKPGQEQENLLSYFDEALKKNWAGPEHWRIRRVKELGKPIAPTKRKEKERFKIDFFSPMSQDLANAIYTSAPLRSSAMLPKSQWKSKTRNLAPDDKHFNSKQLLKLFLKPNVRLGLRRANQPAYGDRSSAAPSDEPDAAHWAAMANEGEAADEKPVVQHDYDADFFQDDVLPMAGAMDDDGETFADAEDHFPPATTTDNPVPTSSMEGDVPTEEGAFGTQLVPQIGRFRPMMLNYAKVDKKVDIKRLKDEIWKGIGFDGIEAPPPTDATDDIASKAVDGSLKFTQVMRSLKSVYPQKAMSDISTSYCFICLLHLANEKGLVIDKQDGLEELAIKRDFSADLSVGH
ncbi:barren [Bimuria novae-zelandiae CBS 107.79]|uniref:Condensin complex subunit 2 n=1 Tax=Bimuria novae-zelandiae CBS 107.79 TaxID=1447943 RepID=A0A6A5UJV5_9PLEO|nr:barren [Bimuria novae-zelandiae CBS 107.79]